MCVHVQEMFLEIEQSVAGLSVHSQAVDHQQQQQQQDELGAVGSQQEAAELLSSKLELLKANLVSFQQLLQDRQDEERLIAHKELQEQVHAVCTARYRGYGKPGKVMEYCVYNIVTNLLWITSQVAKFIFCSC